MAFSELATSTAGSPDARTNLGRDGMAGNAARRFDDLADAEAFAVAQVEDQAALGDRGLFQGAESQKVGIGQVGDVDVVADAGSVGSRVVFAEDFN